MPDILHHNESNRENNVRALEKITSTLFPAAEPDERGSIHCPNCRHGELHYWVSDKKYVMAECDSPSCTGFTQ